MTQLVVWPAHTLGHNKTNGLKKFYKIMETEFPGIKITFHSERWARGEGEIEWRRDILFTIEDKDIIDFNQLKLKNNMWFWEDWLMMGHGNDYRYANRAGLRFW